MTILPAPKIWCMWVFCTVYVRSTVYQTSYTCKKQNVNSEEQVGPLYSVLENNLVSCAVTCWTDDVCRYFVYNRHNRLCHGYGENVCDDGGNDRTGGDVMYQQKCMARCPQKLASYTLTVRTGKERFSGSKADLVVTIGGSCGDVEAEMKNGRDIRLMRGRRSTFKFVADSVCNVEYIGVAFSDSCHRDGWLVSYIVVESEDMTTGDRDRLKLKPNHWLTVNVEDEKTTGIVCYFVPPAVFMFTAISSGGTNCDSSQICEN